MRVVADACVLAAVVFEEAGWQDVLARLDGASIHAPELLKYELGHVVVKKARRDPASAPELIGRLQAFLGRPGRIRWHDVDPVDVAILASVTGLSAYDATYLWLAGWLEADLVTLDRRLASAQER
jgi:predicted nucleic acid-binding protein